MVKRPPGRDLQTAAYVAVIVLLIALPLVAAAGFLVDRQANDVVTTRRKSVALDFQLRLQAVVARLHDLRKGVLIDRRVRLDDRLAVERELTHLYDFASGRGRTLDVEKSLERIQVAWMAVPEHGNALPQIDRTISQAYDLAGRIRDRSSLRTGTDDVVADLIDAFGVQLPTIEERVDQQGSLLLQTHRGAGDAAIAIGASILAAQTQHAYTAATADLDRAAVLQPSVMRAAASLEGVGVAWRTFDRLVARPTGPPRSALVRDGAALATAIQKASADVESEAQQALTNRLADERDALRWLRVDAIGAAVFALLVGFLLWRSIRLRDRRELKRARDEAERLKAERENDRIREALALTEARFEAVFDRAAIGVAILDTSGALVRTNGALERMLPAATPSDVGAAHRDFGRLIAGEIDGYTTEREGRHVDGGGWIEAVVSLVRDDAGAPLFAVAILKDITERRAMDDLLRYEAKHDVLVQLPNRAFLLERMREMLADSTQFGVMFVDLDGFKVVNDSLGHEIGDRVLVAAARRLVSAVDAGDFVARFGGDEFVALLPARATRDETIAAADRVVRALAVPFTIDGREIFVTISAGLALVDRPYDAVEDILRDADTAMYRAKISGRSRCAVFDAEMRDSASRRLLVASQLRRALEREQIFLVFQPVVTLATERIASFEVLVRWEHPELGLVAPGEFIPLAEEIGLIVPIGRWVLERACAQLARWRSESKAFAKIHLAVNASVRELLQTDYCEFVERTLQRHGLRTGDLVLEVTETAVLQSDRYAEGTLQRLKRAGVGLAIDDFGTGYSSLRYLQHFPFDHLKIDAAFVNGPNGELASEAIVSMLLALGRSFGVNVIAEGVETAEQVAMLRSLGCTSVQGFFYGPPVASSVVRDLLENRQARVAS